MNDLHNSKRNQVNRLVALTVLILSILIPSYGASAADPAISSRLQESLQAFSRIMASRQSAVPPVLLQKAEGIIMIPDMLKASFLVGTRFGKGVLMVKGKDGRWSNPALITFNGGSFGLQLGLQSTDLVLVFRRSRALEARARGNIVLGTDMSVVAGTFGLHLDEITEADLSAEIYSFSRSSGLNAGFALQGASIRLDDAATSNLYGKKGLLAQDVLWGKYDTATPEVARFKDTFLKMIGKAQ